MAASPSGKMNRTRVDIEISAARVLSACGEAAAAIHQLDQTRRDAHQLHSMPRELTAGLVLGEVEIAAGRVSAGRAHLAAIEKQARANGFALIARNAAAATTRSKS